MKTSCTAQIQEQQSPVSSGLVERPSRGLLYTAYEGNSWAAELCKTGGLLAPSFPQTIVIWGMFGLGAWVARVEIAAGAYWQRDTGFSMTYGELLHMGRAPGKAASGVEQVTEKHVACSSMMPLVCYVIGPLFLTTDPRPPKAFGKRVKKGPVAHHPTKVAALMRSVHAQGPLCGPAFAPDPTDIFQLLIDFATFLCISLLEFAGRLDAVGCYDDFRQTCQIWDAHRLPWG